MVVVVVKILLYIFLIFCVLRHFQVSSGPGITVNGLSCLERCGYRGKYGQQEIQKDIHRCVCDEVMAVWLKILLCVLHLPVLQAVA